MTAAVTSFSFRQQASDRSVITRCFTPSVRIKFTPRATFHVSMCSLCNVFLFYITNRTTLQQHATAPSHSYRCHTAHCRLIVLGVSKGNPILL